MTVFNAIVRSRILPWALFVVAALAAVLFAVQWNAEADAGARAAEVEEEAGEFAIALTNFSSQTIEADVADIRRYATGAFAKEVDELFSRQVIDAISQARATSTAEIEALFVQTVGDTSATVFAVLSETVDNRNLDRPRTDTVRMEIGMVETSEGWKVERVELFQTPGTGIGPAG